MKNKLHILVMSGLLLSTASIQPITDVTATTIATLSAPLYYKLEKILINEGYYEGDWEASSLIIGLFAAGSSAGTYGILYQFTPQGRLRRANKIVEKLKDQFPRIFGTTATDNEDQILHDLGAFRKTYKNNRNFVTLNALEELDRITSKLKEAESLLIAAKKDIFYSPAELIKMGIHKVRHKISALLGKNNSTLFASQPEKYENNSLVELTSKIDMAQADVRQMLQLAAELYSYIELRSAQDFKTVLKDREELNALRSQITRSEVINFVIPTATVVGSLAITGLVGAHILRPFLRVRENRMR